MSRQQFDRTSRVASLVRQEIARLITFEIKDPAVKGVTVTDAEITGDLREGRIFYVCPGDEAAQKAAQRGLQRAAGFMRRALGQRIRMRVTPSLTFHYDPSMDYGARIDAALAEIQKTRSAQEEAPEGDLPEGDAQPPLESDDH